MLKLTRFFVGAVLALAVSTVSAETIYVTNGNDSGAGSLRQAINDANSDASSTLILINIPGPLGSDRIINVPTALPAFTSPVELRIDGTQTGKAVLKAPIINGPGAATTGLTFNVGSAGSSVSFITFRDFVFSVVLKTAHITVSNNIFENNQGGIDVQLYAPNAAENSIIGNQFTTTHNANAIGGASGGNIIKGNSFTGEGINIGGAGNQIGGTGNNDGNTFTNVNGNAILIGGSGSVILHNTINGSTSHGITIAGTDNLIQSNNLSGNVGWDIQVSNGHSNRINLNQIQGSNNGIFNGINVADAVAVTINNNWVTAGSIELTNVSSSAWYGQLRITSNTIVNDPNGFSGHGALSLFNVQSAFVYGNFIHHNGGHGILLSNSTNNTIRENFVYENFRVGINVGSNLYNKITRNYIYYNHADVYGGKTGILATAKAAPVITSAKRVGLNFVLTGTGTVAGDTVEVFLSTAASRNSNFAQDATSHKGSFYASGTTWTGTIPVGPLNGGEIYFIATATNNVNTTSTFSKAVGVEINGPTSVTVNIPAIYSAEYIPGATYSWWSSLPISSLTQNGNQATFTFNQVGSGTVSVGYTDPGTGQWKQYSLAVTVSNSARQSADNDQAAFASEEVVAYPNPFNSQISVTLEGEENISVFLYNANGELVYTSEGHQHGQVLELGQNIGTGIYTLKTVSGSEVKTTRVVKVQ